MSERDVRIVHVRVSDELCPAGLIGDRHQLGAEPSCPTCREFAERSGRLEPQPSDHPSRVRHVVE